MRIELRGNEASFRKLIADLNSCISDPMSQVIAELEDQLEPQADRELDFIDLDALYYEE